MSRLRDIVFINNLRKKEIWCNAKITSYDGISFCVHSPILMASSDFFRAAFQFGPNKGKKGTERSNVFVPCVDGNTLESVIKYAYFQPINFHNENIWNITLAADFLLMDQLFDECVAYIYDNMNINSCLSFLHQTESYIFLPTVRDKAIQFAAFNLCDTSLPLEQRNNFLQDLSVTSFQPLICNDVLNAPREELVWEAIRTWVAADPTTREQYLARLIRSVRFGFLSTQYIQQVILHDELVRSDPKARATVLDMEGEVKRWMDHRSLVPPASVFPRVPHTIVLSVGGWIHPGPTHIINMYDPAAERWMRATAMEEPNHVCAAYHGLVKLGDYLYVVGGSERGANRGGIDSAQFMRLKLSNFSWERLPNLSIARNFISCVEAGGKIYAFGGRDSNRLNVHHRHASGEVFDPHTSTWTTLPDMHDKRSDAGYALLDEKIYVVGGYDGEYILRSAECFDLVKQRWEILPSMVNVRSGLRCVALRGQIFAIGGYSGHIRHRETRLSSVERFNPVQQTWRFVSPMLTPRSNFSATVWRDYIIVSGGFNEGQTVNVNELYDAFEDRWYSMEPLPMRSSALNTITLENSFDLAQRIITGAKSEFATPDLIERRLHRTRPPHVSEIRPIETPLPDFTVDHTSINEQESITSSPPENQNHYRNWVLLNLFGNAEEQANEQAENDWSDLEEEEEWATDNEEDEN